MAPALLARVGGHSAKAIITCMLAMPAYLSLGALRLPDDPNLTPLPPRPHSVKEAVELPPKLTAWVSDHFGFRTSFIEAGNILRFRLFHEFSTVQLAYGQNGRYFMAAHAKTVGPYQAMTTVCGKGKANDSTIPYLNKLFTAFHAAGMQPKLLVVPSSPAVYPEDVPSSLVEECTSTDTAAARVLAAPELLPEARSAILYPLKEMREIKKTATLFPKTWFHWGGAGLDQVARLTVSTFWQMPLDQPPLKLRTYMDRSDLAHMMIGIDLKSEMTDPDHGASGIQACFGGDCFPEIASVSRILGDVSRFRNPHAPKRRLLIVSDSFGAKMAQWLSRYYGEVEHFCSSHTFELSPQQVDEMKAYIYRQPADTDILFLYHDGGAMYDVLRNGTQMILPAPLAPTPTP
ncbi:hypothetical protein HF313_28505 [Massilia atriviolacea]|uniref:AlgX/AlgJ SGNH hydrolase-like domain-containing protein n=1 Tax=Massilia atriviolacea TaxID=2495579 RepID=A0A430HEL8_9BURK|nr:hypothetical protein [Massilia atriviolacea]RSZ55963.1 hypothetical protein EJB06_26510 [Massilia atriviolacea]